MIDENQRDGLDYMNTLWNLFSKALNTSISKYIPFKKNKLKYKTKLPLSLRNSIKLKNKLWKKFINLKDNNIFLEYKKLRNSIKRSIIKIKEENTLKLARKIKYNPKVFWNHIKKLKSNKIRLDYLVKNTSSGNIILVKDQDKANYLAEFFKSVYTQPNIVGMNNYVPNHNICLIEMDDFVVSDFDVMAKLDSLNKFKSAGPDNIFSRVIIECKYSICKFLCFLFNESLRLKIVPSEWRFCIITPIFKKGDRFAVNNYRPVSLSCICCKVLESMIKDALLDHFKRNKLLDHRQHGFMKGRSTTIQLMKLMDEWSEAIDRGEEVDVIYTDFEKAFDRVPHNKLIQKLIGYGVNVNLIEWIMDFLRDRTSCVRVNGSLSDYFNVTSGVPQGSVLGPLLFIIYVNDMFQILDGNDSLGLFLYADDAKLFKCVVSNDDREMLQICLNALVNWCDEWDIKLNVDKCVSMRYGGKSNVNVDWYYKIGTYDLNYNDKIKDLGVIFDCSLKFNFHIQDKINKCFSLLGLISRNFPNLTKDAFILLYKSMVRSHLEYAVSIWYPWTWKDIEAVERVQRRATKMVKDCYGLSYVERLKMLELPCLRMRRVRGDLLYVFRMLTNKDDVECYPRLKMHEDGRTREHNFKLDGHRFKKDIRKYSFTNRVVNLWNSLPCGIVNACSMNDFKNKFDDFISTNESLYNYRQEIIF